MATIKLVSGAAFIYREQQERYLPIKFSVRGRDLGSAIREAQVMTGMMLAPLVILVTLPVLISFFSRRAR